MGETKAKKWSVRVPFSGYIILDVEAPTVAAALEVVRRMDDISLDKVEDYTFQISKADVEEVK